MGRGRWFMPPMNGLCCRPKAPHPPVPFPATAGKEATKPLIFASITNQIPMNGRL